MIEIRPACHEDIGELRRIAIETQIDTFAQHNTPEVLEAYLEDAYSLASFENEFRGSDPGYYIAWAGTESVGFLRLRVTNEVEDTLGKNAIELQRLYVTKKFHGKKVGAALMNQALAHARKKNFEWIWLGVWEGNHKAQEFYKRWGFEKFSEHIFWMGPDPQTDWLLKLKL